MKKLNGMEELQKTLSKATVNAMRNYLEKKLEPFQIDINASDGEVFINISDDLKNISVSSNDLPEELMERIRLALQVEQ